jgi:hypothetical protein
MRKLIITGMAVAMLAVPAAASANAGASTDIGTSGVGTSQGNAKNTTTQYKASYVDPVMGGVSCTGVHKDGKNTGFTLGTDTWTCTSTTGSPLSGVVPGPLDIGWNSDYAPLKGLSFPTVTAHMVISADGMSETGTAAYGDAIL